MKQRLYISIFLALALLLAGCIGGGSSKTQIVSTDMLVIKSVDIFPLKTLQPDDSIIIRMEVENAGQADAHLLVDADSSKTDTIDADYLLIDHCSTLYRATKDAQVLSGGKCEAIYDEADKKHESPLIPLVKDSAGNPIKDGCYMKLAPQESQTFQWALKAPKEEEIAKMTQKCIFKFQAAYAAQAVTNAYVYFADPLELAQRIYTKKEMSLAGDNVASYGPIAVNFVPAEPQPIPVRKEGNEKWTVFLNMKNAGSGIADVNELNLQMPEGITASNCIIAGGLSELNNKLRVSQLLKDYLTTDSYVKILKIDVSAAIQQYMTNCLKGDICSDENKKFVKTYSDFCGQNAENTFCKADLFETIKSLTDELNSAKSQLQIYSQKSSRIPCDLTMPAGVAILTPFRFTTTADYTYKIRQDIDITTKPLRETA